MRATTSAAHLLVIVLGQSVAIASTSEDAAFLEEPLPSEDVECVELLQSKLDLVQLEPPAAVAASYEHPPWLNQCKQIYLDVGSNIGVQVRKLFEPEKYPGALILPLFEKKFGSAEARRVDGKESGICALGFEPNPNWEGTLQALESEFQAKGRLVHFYPYAVSGSDGTALFQVSDSDDLKDWDANVTGLVQVVESRNVTVKKIDFYRFLQDLPRASVVKLMKMDIEGSEWDTLARLLPANGLCNDRIEEAFIECHPEKGSAANWKGNRSFEVLANRLTQQDCSDGPTVMSDLDDETYLDGVHYDWRAAKTD